MRTFHRTARSSHALLCGLAAICLAVVSGCHGPGSRTEPPEVELPPGRLLVLPFADGLRGSFESLRGSALALAVHDEMTGSEVLRDRLVSWESLDEILADYPDPARVDPQDLAGQAQARFLLRGRIVRLVTRSTGGVGLMHGEGVVEYELLDLDTGDVLYRGRAGAQYPEDQLGDWGISGLELDDGEVESGLLVRLAREIGHHFMESQPGQD